jgi:nicotinic acid mononucleotide adenylyltransferase
MEIVDYKAVYFTFGRFQPPTKGHGENFEQLQRIAGENDYYIYMSASQDKKGENPLSVDRKVHYAKKMFPRLASKIRAAQPKGLVPICQELQAAGYDDLYLVVGSDRVKDMQWIKNYNGKEFVFRKMEIVSSGKRDADGKTFKISGTNQRIAAVMGNFTTFKAGCPENSISDSDIKKLMKEIKDNMPKNYSPK